VVSEQSHGSSLVSQYPANQIPTNDYNPAGSSAYSPYFFTLSGTSMAAPVVSGAALMLIDQNQGITRDQVKAKLMRTAWRGFPYTMTIPVTVPTAFTYTVNEVVASKETRPVTTYKTVTEQVPYTYTVTLCKPGRSSASSSA